MRLALFLLVASSLVAGVARGKPHKKGKATHKVVAAKVAGAAHPSVAHVPPAPPEVLFTFDDGPDLSRTPKVLATLEAHHIHAVFFVNGVHFMGTRPNAEKSRALLREEIHRGHYVGNHTVHHFFLCGTRGPKIAAAEITENADLIEQATGIRPELFRTPYGSHCKSLSETLAKLNVHHTGWDVDPQDWKVNNAVLVRDFIIKSLKTMRGRNIVLMHDIHDDTVQALPQILDWLDAENAARIQRGEVPIKVLDYSYLLPPHPSFPPLLDALGRMLIDLVPPVERAFTRLVAWWLAAAASRA